MSLEKKLAFINPDAAVEREKEELFNQLKYAEQQSEIWSAIDSHKQYLYCELAESIRDIYRRLNANQRFLNTGNLREIAIAYSTSAMDGLELTDLGLIDAVGFFGTTDIQLVDTYGVDPFTLRVRMGKKGGKKIFATCLVGDYITKTRAIDTDHIITDEYPNSAMKNAIFVYSLTNKGHAVLEVLRARLKRERATTFEEEKFYCGFQRLLVNFLGFPVAAILFLYLCNEPELREHVKEELFLKPQSKQDTIKVGRSIQSIMNSPWADYFEKSKIPKARSHSVTLQLSMLGLQAKKMLDISRF